MCVCVRLCGHPYVCGHTIYYVGMSRTLERSQLWGYRLRTVAPSPIRASDLSRVHGSALPSLVKLNLVVVFNNNKNGLVQQSMH